MYLNCHSYFSLRYGTISMDNLVAAAANAYGMGDARSVAGARIAPAMALTDINNSTGIMDFVAACKEKGIKPIAGIEFRREDQLLYTGLARNNEGFRELNEFLSHHNLNNLPLPDRAPEMENVFVIYPFTSPPGPLSLRRGGAAGGGEVLIGIRPSELSPLMLSRHRELIPRMVLMAPVTFRNEMEYELHRNFRAVDHNVLLTRLEANQVAASDEIMLPVDELLESCRDFPEIIRNTEKLIEACSIDFDFKSCKNKKTFTGDRYDDRIHFFCCKSLRSIEG